MKYLNKIVVNKNNLANLKTHIYYKLMVSEAFVWE